MAESGLRRGFTLAGLTALYVAAGRFGLSLAIVNASASAVWPPTGIAVAALLLLGQGMWPAIAAGAFIVNFLTSGDPGASAAISLGNTIEVAAAAWLVRRYANGPGAFDHPGTILRFTAVAGATSTIAATVGTATLLAGGFAAAGDVASIWVTWWLGDAVGMLLIAPLMLLWRRGSRPEVGGTPRRGEAVLLAASLAAVAFAVFGGSPVARERYPLEFLVVPLLLWPAFRFGGRATAAAALLVAGIAIEATLRGSGPFARGNPNESLLFLQGFIGVTTTVMLAVSAEVTRRRGVEAEIRALNDSLERRVAGRTEELTLMQARLNEAQRVAHIGSWEWDIGANALWWSDELYRIYGIDGGAAPTYEAYLDRIHPEDRSAVEAAVRQALADGRPFAFEHRIVRPDGTTRVLHGAGHVVAGEDGRPIRMIGIGHDITERRRAEDAREQLIREQAARRQAEDASVAKDRFLAVLSHELRTPLNAALGWSRMLFDVPNLQQSAVRAAQTIHRNLLVQSRLVADILDISKAAAGSLAVEQAPVDVAGVIRAAIETVRGAAAARSITFETSGLEQPVVVIGDAQRLQQVVWNLLDNAVKFSPAAGRVRVDLAPDTSVVDIRVRDDGPGIAADFLPHIFDEFRQADESVTRAHGGLGLGLAIARHIVVRHGGRIVARNCDEGGAEFRVRLPVNGHA